MAVENPVRTALLAIGGCSLSGGLLLVASPSVAALIRWPRGADLLLVGCFTLAFTVAALLVPFGTWDLEGPSGSEPDAPERIPTAPVPGRDLERIVDDRWPVPLPAERRRRLREQLRETAVRTLVRTTDRDRAAAETSVATGAWTDDPVAAAFVRPSGPDRERSCLESLWDRLWFTYRMRRAATAVAAITAGTGARTGTETERADAAETDR